MKNLNKTMLALALVPMSLSAKPAEKPNVIIILADDIGYGDLSCYGATKVRTPNLDKLAQEGRMFTDMHSASAVSTPSRFALLTGKYPWREKIAGPAGFKSKCLIPNGQLTIADVMKRSGYATAAIGKWHLGFGEERADWNKELKPGPLERGFDYYFGVPVVNSSPPHVLVENHSIVGYDPNDPIVAGAKPETKSYPEKVIGKLGGAKLAHSLYDEEMLGTQFAEKSVEWIKNHKKEPFFLYLATVNIHHPFVPHPRFVGTSEAGIYGDFIHELDWIVGEVMNALKETGLDKNTLVMFSSDNGGMLNQGGQGAMDKGHKINGDLFGFKFDAWEGGHTVPLIVRYPGKIKAGSVSSQLISNVDILHSLASFVGYELKDGDAPDSYNMLPVIMGKTTAQMRESTTTAASKLTHIAYREGDWVYIDAIGGGGFTQKKHGQHAFGGASAANYYKKENSEIENGEFKEDIAPRQLYNLKKDPYQTTNLAKSNPEKADEMKAKLLEIKAGKSTR